MIDCQTREQVRVNDDGDTGPYIIIPASQFEELHKLLDKHKIPHWREHDHPNDQPDPEIVNLGNGADVEAIQILLDSYKNDIEE